MIPFGSTLQNGCPIYWFWDSAIIGSEARYADATMQAFPDVLVLIAQKAKDVVLMLICKSEQV